MKIAFIVHDYHRMGGHSRYVAELATRFAKRHEVHVYANRIVPDDNAGIHYHYVPAWRANAFTTVLSFIIPATVQIGPGFDIVHSQGFCGFRGNVFTVHRCNRAWHQALKNTEGGPTWRESIFNNMGALFEHVVYRYARHSAVIAISQRVLRDIQRFYRCPSPTSVIHHGVDLETFSPATRLRWRCEIRKQIGLPDNEMAFIYVGNLRKGARNCILALAQLEQGRLLLVSHSAPEEYQRLAKEAGVSDRVHFLGGTNQVERFYAAADAFLLPSPYDEFAMVVSEAMACGLPSVVSREAGASELIRHGVNGLLLEDVTGFSELAGHMDALQRDPGAALAMGCAARKTVEPMTWDAVAGQTMQVYERLLRSSD